MFTKSAHLSVGRILPNAEIPQIPAVQVSFAVHRLPSSQAAPSARAALWHTPESAEHAVLTHGESPDVSQTTGALTNAQNPAGQV